MANLKNRLLKDIITENAEFSTESFVPTLKTVMYTEDQFARTFCIGWVQSMHKVPNPEIVKFLPDIIGQISHQHLLLTLPLDGVYKLLGWNFSLWSLQIKTMYY